MDGTVLVHQSHLEVHGASYQIFVYCRQDGRHFAQTHLGGDDIIINDGDTLEEVLSRHQRLLPLAVGSRMISRELRNCVGSAGEYRA